MPSTADGHDRPPPMGPGMGPDDGEVPNLLQIGKTFSALGIPAYRFLWLSMLASFAGMQMQFLARSVLAYDIGGTAGSIAFVSMGWAVPMLFLSLIGGTVADRMDRRRLMILAQVGTAVLAATTAVMVEMGVMTLVYLFVMGMLQGIIFSFSGPARQAFIPQVVGDKELLNAIALNMAGMNLTAVGAPPLAGVLIAVPLVDIEGVFFIQAALNVVAVFLLWRMPRGVEEDADLSGGHERRPITSDLMDGFRYVVRSPILLTLLAMGLVPSLLGMSTQNFLPIWAKNVFGDGVDKNSGVLGIMMMSIAIGALAGSLVIASMQEYPRRTQLQLMAGIGYGGSIAFFAVQGNIVPAFIGLMSLGFMANFFMALNSTMTMTACDRDFYGRVMSVNMMTFALMPLGTLPTGFIADAIGWLHAGPLDLIGVQVTSLASGLLIVGFILLVTVLNPAYRRLEHQDFRRFADVATQRVRDERRARDEVGAAGN